MTKEVESFIKLSLSPEDWIICCGCASLLLTVAVHKHVEGDGEILNTAIYEGLFRDAMTVSVYSMHDDPDALRAVEAAGELVKLLSPVEPVNPASLH